MHFKLFHVLAAGEISFKIEFI